ncbi:hypothetical protein WOLCODRAFT_157115 [Wolfiporia cocos MD-104 SS10]|uniref:Uncharacterized protein n=1 Tax=Wolfiporia cocos (strain MD-104) TaxID=742152 RepID=A0A2H3J2E8_WOLCO|nr:hypothetical protein WOLCODRAFT_157115 [Wolfiporia cocos MD-104 SS10]
MSFFLWKVQTNVIDFKPKLCIFIDYFFILRFFNIIINLISLTLIVTPIFAA